MRRNAAAFAEMSGNADDAVQLWIEAGAWEELGAYLRRAAPVLLGQGRGQLLAAWIGAVPAARRDRDPWLRFWLGQCHMGLASVEARAHREEALAIFQAQGERTEALLAWAGIVDVMLHQGQAPAQRRSPAMAGSFTGSPPR